DALENLGLRIDLLRSVQQQLKDLGARRLLEVVEGAEAVAEERVFVAARPGELVDVEKKTAEIGGGRRQRARRIGGRDVGQQASGEKGGAEQLAPRGIGVHDWVTTIGLATLTRL